MGSETKHLVSDKLLRVEFLPSRDNKADVLSLSPSSEQIEGVVANVCGLCG